MIVHAPAKVNLTLEVLGKRPDGYHEIRSVMRALALHDTIQLDHSETLSVSCQDEALSGPANLAYRAAVLLREVTGYTGGACITIQKEIPMAAGLGGGSSDAAATLHGLNQLWRTNLQRETLATLGAQLGSDVPFFLYGDLALVSGRGELVQPLPMMANCTVLLVRPATGVATPAIYAAVTADSYSDGSLSERCAALPSAASPREWPLYNALQAVTCAAYPVVAEVLHALRAWGAFKTLMCGSGSTCFGLFENEAAAWAAAHEAEGNRQWSAWVTSFR